MPHVKKISVAHVLDGRQVAHVFIDHLGCMREGKSEYHVFACVRLPLGELPIGFKKPLGP